MLIHSLISDVPVLTMPIADNYYLRLSNLFSLPPSSPHQKKNCVQYDIVNLMYEY
jgi:hypothetical protein